MYDAWLVPFYICIEDPVLHFYAVLPQATVLRIFAFVDSGHKRQTPAHDNGLQLEMLVVAHQLAE